MTGARGLLAASLLIAAAASAVDDAKEPRSARDVPEGAAVLSSRAQASTQTIYAMRPIFEARNLHAEEFAGALERVREQTQKLLATAEAGVDTSAESQKFAIDASALRAAEAAMSMELAGKLDAASVARIEARTQEILDAISSVEAARDSATRATRAGELRTLLDRDRRPLEMLRQPVNPGFAFPREDAP